MMASIFNFNLLKFLIELLHNVYENWDSGDGNRHFKKPHKEIGVPFQFYIKLLPPRYARKILERNEFGQIIKTESPPPAVSVL